jgi:2-polyprenyl-6-methoxyphenol hydroxylase-like FAD-dependent oxidoreductase
MTEFVADVIIVGAGPCGLFVGCELAQAGVKVLILEKRSGPTLPRAGNLQPRVLEIFDCRGLAEGVEARARELHSKPRASVGIWAGFPGVRYDVLETRFPYMLFLAQIETENILTERFIELGGEIRLQHEVTTLTQDHRGVHIGCIGPDGSHQIIGCRYAVGADGARSTVREAVGITCLEEPERHIAWGIHARTTMPFDYPITTVTNERGWSLVYPHSKEITRFSVIDAQTTADCNHEPTLEDMKAALRRIHGTDFGISEIVGIRSFGDALRFADRMRNGRVFLVGDSVRTHYPASGVGLNFAFQDAFNLAWKLAAVARGWGPEWLLDSYEAERRPQVEAHLEQVRIQTEIQFNYTPGMNALKRFMQRLLAMPDVNHEIASFLGGFSTKYASAPGSPNIVGKRLTDLPVVDQQGNKERLFVLLRKQGFIYLHLSSEPPPDLPEFSDRVWVASTNSASVASLKDLRAVLVRPDGHIAHAWRTDDPVDRRRALTHWCGQPIKVPA